jgi:small conductance mechanosensitive channel
VVAAADGEGLVLSVTFVDRISRFGRDQGLQIVLVVLGTILAVRLVRWVVSRVELRMGRGGDTLVPTEEAKRRSALLGVATYVGVFLSWAIATFMILQRLGVNTGPLVASASVLGLAFGFGAQSLVRDVVAGFFIIAENQYGIGDVVEINSGTGVIGTVENVTLRTTTLRAVSGEAHIVPNGEIRRVKNMSREWSRAVVDVVLTYKVDLPLAFAALDDVISQLKEDETLAPFLLEDPEVWGVEELGDAAVKVRVVAKTLPLKQWEVARDLRRLVIEELQRREVALPSSS